MAAGVLLVVRRFHGPCTSRRCGTSSEGAGITTEVAKLFDDAGQGTRPVRSGEDRPATRGASGPIWWPINRLREEPAPARATRRRAWNSSGMSVEALTPASGRCSPGSTRLKRYEALGWQKTRRGHPRGDQGGASPATPRHGDITSASRKFTDEKTARKETIFRAWSGRLQRPIRSKKSIGAGRTSEATGGPLRRAWLPLLAEAAGFRPGIAALGSQTGRHRDAGGRDGTGGVFGKIEDVLTKLNGALSAPGRSGLHGVGGRIPPTDVAPTIEAYQALAERVPQLLEADGRSALEGAGDVEDAAATRCSSDMTEYLANADEAKAHLDDLTARARRAG